MEQRRGDARHPVALSSAISMNQEQVDRLDGLSRVIRALLFLAVMAVILADADAGLALRATVVMGVIYVVATTFSRASRASSANSVLLALDVLLISALIYLSGGPHSFYYPLYYLVILNASLRLSLRDAVAVSLLSAASYYFVTISQGEQEVVTFSRHVLVFSGGGFFMAVFFSLLAQETKASMRLSELYRKANEYKTDFVAYVAHEFGNSLSAIIGFCQLLQEKPDDPGGPEYLGIMRSEAERLSRMISDLMDLSLLEAGRMKVAMGSVRLPELLAWQAALFNEPSKRSKVIVHLQEGLPPIQGSRDRLQQVVQNLVGNALKFSPPEETVLVEASREGADQVVIAVTDHGPGIPEDQVQRMFERYERLQRDDDKAGSGLGLAITRGIVELHGGTISISSKPGLTTFRVVLPIAGPTGAADPEQARVSVQPLWRRAAASHR